MKKFKVCCYIAFLFYSGFLVAQESKPPVSSPLISIVIEQDETLGKVVTELASKVAAKVNIEDSTLKETPLIAYEGKAARLQDILEVIAMQTGYTVNYANGVITVKNDQFNTHLEDITLVAIGYGDKKKQNITTSVTEVDTRALKNRPLSNAVSALQGNTPGLNITNSSGKEDAEANINIRGFNSVNGGGPLVLIDGVEGSLSNINPDDIESISVLKDAGAAAVYGARGAFGVVLVKTKNPGVGEIKVSVNSTMNILSQTQNTDFVTDPYLAAKIVDQAFITGSGRSYTGYNEYDYEQLKAVSENPALARVEIQNRNGRDQYVHYGSTDWWNYFWKDTRYSYINDISISGGSEKVKGYFSYRNYSADGLLKVQDDKYKKNNLRAKFDIKINDWISFSTNNQYFKSSDLVHGGTQYGWRDPWTSEMLVHALPSYIPVNPDGGALWRTELNNYTIGDGYFASLLHGKSNRTAVRDEFSTINAFHFKPLKNLDVHASYAYKKNTRDINERSTLIPYSILPNQIQYFGENKLNVNETIEDYNALNIYGQYRLDFGDHNFDFMAGYNQEYFKNDNRIMSIQNLISDDLDNLGLGSSNPTVVGSAYEWALRGYFYRFSYDYAGKYLLELNGRYDATSKFPSEQRWQFFPSVSLGWNVANEPFFKRTFGFWNQFKIRASYGELGNQAIGAYAYIPTLNKAIDKGYALDGALLEYMQAPSLNPRDITWETVATSDIGFDLGFFQNKLNVSFDYFQKDIEGMLTKGRTLPGVLGTESPRENAADLRAKGFEVSVGYNDSFKLAGSDFNYSVSAGLSDSKTKITRFDNPTGLLTDYYVGMELGEIWGYSVEGLFSSPEQIANHADQSRVSAHIIANGGLQPGDVMFKDLNGDGIVSEGANTLENHGDMRKIGNTAPRYQYNFRLAFDWKGIDFSAFFQGVGKQDWYPDTDSRMFWGPYNRPYNSFIRQDLANDIWTPENTDAYFPRLVGYTSLGSNRQLGVQNDRYLQDISYLRLKNITLGYSLPQDLVKRVKMDKVRIYVSGENLFTFTNLTDYIDPEAASNSFDFNSPNSARKRTNAQSFPFSKIISFGVQLNF
ncbi:SusC/RagA family TonB-linked outer membrane protein [Myroides odoratimimus CCUG 12901]|uniref:SusC/RagA family TonB-linked outer membrane protein n=1 Tax=Myroides odoratimimus TaxID=76832 RepID=UPI000246074D|nr:SusC/RagA family TonB-linked outer membrane protein [Myroides odoratimimus]EHO09276.1 SusC/RagA family TonB-linked outer membrane protein [Myroides odoratimimus CCUG 12901]